MNDPRDNSSDSSEYPEYNYIPNDDAVIFSYTSDEIEYPEYNCIPNDDAAMFAYTSDEIVNITTVLPIMLVLGLLTNGAFLFVVIHIKSMRTITNRYLSSLAIADITYLLVRNLHYLIPYLTVPVFFSEQYMGSAGCVLIPLLLDVTLFMSIAMVTIVSLDRFYAVHKPQENRFRYTRKYSSFIIASSWAACFVVSGFFQIPSGGKLRTMQFCDDWGNKSDIFPPVYAQCTPYYRPQFTSVARVCLTVPFFASMIINFVLYTRIIYLLSSRAGSSVGGKKSNQQTRNRITIMLVITGVLFFTLFAPYEISMLITTTMYMQEDAPMWWLSPQWSRWYEVCKILVCILHIINPIIYNATNRRYREAFARAFCVHDLIYRVRKPPGNSYKSPHSANQTDVTGMDTTCTQNEVVRLHCFDGPTCNKPASSKEVDEDVAD